MRYDDPNSFPEIMDCLELINKLKSMKHFIMTLKDFNGEYEHRIKILIKAEDQDSAEIYAKTIQRGWYNDSKAYWDKDYRFRYFNGGEVATYVEEVIEIPKEHYLVMKNYIHEM